MKKYIVPVSWDCHGSVYDTKEEAQKRAIHDRDLSDDMTGYFRAFGKHSHEPEEVIPMEYRIVSREEYLANERQIERKEEEYEREIAKLRREMFAPLEKVRMAYVNFNTNYEHYDLIKLTIRKNGRKRSITGIVCGAMVTDEGEIRPSLRGKNYPTDAEIVSIEVLKKAMDMTKQEIYENS